MADNERFQFSAAEKEPEDTPIFQEDAQARRIERLSRRVTFIGILLPCLIGLLLYFGYRDLTGRMSRSQSSGVQEVQKLSEELQLKFDGLASRLEQMEAALAKLEGALQSAEATLSQKLTATETAASALEGSMQTTTQKLGQLSGAFEELKASKPDRDELAQAEDRLNAALLPVKQQLEALEPLQAEIQALAPLREEIGTLAGLRAQVEDVSERISTLENSLGKDLNAFATYVEKTNRDIEQIQTSINGLGKDKVGQQELSLELLRAQKSSRLIWLQEVTKLQKSMNAIEDRILKLERAGQRSSILSPPASDS